MLRAEAEAVHQADLAGVPKDELYRALNGLNSAALCLSGGGIRSAAFALGVIQSLAAHPRLPDGNPVAAAEQSLLRQFHYLSTVSGGGYIGSWLSAWLARTGFNTVWRNLVGRPDGPDSEPASIGWLRSYSNYLTPELGLVSADTWAIVAVYLRNLSSTGSSSCRALRGDPALEGRHRRVDRAFQHQSRGAAAPPGRDAGHRFPACVVELHDPQPAVPSRRCSGPDAGREPERRQCLHLGSLIWSLLSAVTLTQYLGIINTIIDAGGALLFNYPKSMVVAFGTLGGALIYALAWLVAAVGRGSPGRAASTSGRI